MIAEVNYKEGLPFMGDIVDTKLIEGFECSKCKHNGAQVEHLAISGAGWTRVFGWLFYRYVFVSCKRCGYTEIYHLDRLRNAVWKGNFPPSSS
jgi:predicted nucleic-acid-binding Zn-ribbon protein